jgi:hypothetical protein
MKFRVSHATLMVASFLVVPLFFLQPAAAALGGDLASVQADGAHMKGAIRSSQASAYTLHEIDAPDHVTVREYISPQGKVFGVGWSGQSRPDLRQVMGGYFDQFSRAEAAQKSGARGRRPLVIRQPGLVVEMGGHMRAFSGRAYIPDMLPDGVGPGEVQ